MPRKEGQIWINRRFPYTAKYYAGGKEYWFQSISTYRAVGTISAGQIVAQNPDNSPSISDTVVPAVWPRDAGRVIGVALNSAINTGPVRVGNYGYVKLDLSEDENALKSVFVTQSDTKTSAALSGTTYYSAFGNTTADGGGGNGWEDVFSGGMTTKNGRGQPVYWFSGRTLKTGASTYTWEDPSSRAGRITFATPTGYKKTMTEIPWNDDKLNVAYNHLPQIGTVVDYTYNASYEIQSLVLHINVIPFQRRTQFLYPASGLKEYAADPANPAETEITILHGLFPNSSLPHVDLAILGYADSDLSTAADGEAFRVYPGYDSYISGTDRRTEVGIVSDTSFFLKVKGDVTYTQ